MVERLLVTSSYLAQIGLSPIALEAPQTGTVLIKSNGEPELIVYTVGCGVLPSYLPVIGGHNFLLSIKHSTKKTTPQPKIEWSVTITGTKVAKIGDMTITRTDNTITVTFIGTVPTGTLILTPTIIAPPITTTITTTGFAINFFQAESEGENGTPISPVGRGPSRYYGKFVVIDVIPTITPTTPTVPCTIDFIQFVSYTSTLNGTPLPPPFSNDWQVDTPTSSNDPTFATVVSTSGGTKILADGPGLGITEPTADPDRAGKTMTMTFRFNTWIIRKCDPGYYEILGFFDWGFTLTITYGPTGSITGSTVNPTPPIWTAGSPDPNSADNRIKDAGGRYKDLMKPFEKGGWPKPPQ
jgi:hypothetical protein